MKKASVVWIVLIQWALAIEWLHSGWGKWAESGFMANIGKTLGSFADKTPYAAYGNFVRDTVIPNAELFGNAIRSGEILVGAALVLGGIILLSKKSLPPIATWLVGIALIGGALMNLNFFLAAGSTSPSTWGVNVVMFLIQLVLAIYYLSNRKDLV